MYVLELHGVQTVLADRAENDLWARTPSGRMLTVQVKTASEPTAYGTEVTFSGLNAGSILPVQVTKCWSTGSTATNVIALY